MFSLLAYLLGPSELLAARFSACFFRAYLTGLSRICYCFLLESILLPLGSFFLSDAAATAASCSMITLCSGGHSPALCLYSPGTSVAAPAAACPGAVSVPQLPGQVHAHCLRPSWRGKEMGPEIGWLKMFERF